jgi:hypothetical protein
LEDQGAAEVARRAIQPEEQGRQDKAALVAIRLERQETSAPLAAAGVPQLARMVAQMVAMVASARHRAFLV